MRTYCLTLKMLIMEDRIDNTPQEFSNRENQAKSNTSRRGFASMDPQKQRSIASEGGRAAHRQGVAHEWNSEEAREAGRKGGQNSHGGGRNRVRMDNRENMEENRGTQDTSDEGVL